MNERNHGLALLIVNDEFRHNPNHPNMKELSQRKGAREDTEKLRQTWTDLGYRVQVEENLTVEEIETVFDHVREDGDPEETIQEGDDSFVCCISSHGTWDQVQGAGVVYGADGVRREDGHAVEGAVDIKALAYKKFAPLETGCPKLKGQPKIFFIQACRGGRCERAISISDSETDQPPEMDFLFMYPTAPGRQSYRDDVYGSFFITNLCALLTLYADKCDLISILQAVIQKETVLDDPRELCSNKGEIVRTTRQCPTYDSSLCAPVFLSTKARRRYKRLALC